MTDDVGVWATIRDYHLYARGKQWVPQEDYERLQAAYDAVVDMHRECINEAFRDDAQIERLLADLDGYKGLVVEQEKDAQRLKASNRALLAELARHKSTNV